jgi:hypothetical protein
MKSFLIVLMFLSLPSAYALPRQRQQQNQAQNKLQPGKRANPDRPLPRRALVEDAMLGFYINQFQQATEVSPELFAKILPFLQQFVQDRFEIGDRRQRALNQIRQAVNRGGSAASTASATSDDDLRRAVREADNADVEFQANQTKFLSGVDPLLNVRQQARLRIFLVMADNRVRQILNTVQNPGNQQRQNAGPPQQD